MNAIDWIEGAQVIVGTAVFFAVVVLVCEAVDYFLD